MTDGIIQEVFKKYKPNFNVNYYSIATTQLLNELQQELIEKIKQEFPITEPFLHVYGAKRVRRMLIGDNQE